MTLVCAVVALTTYWLRSLGSVAATPLHARNHIIRSVYRPLPPNGSGGPILILSSPANPFSRYYSEILLAEGFNEFTIQDVAQLTPAILKTCSAAILGELTLAPAQRKMLVDWVRGGGSLIAMRPDKDLAAALGLTAPQGVLQDAYLAINTQSTAGKGLVKETIQFHGPADLYPPAMGATVATLFRDANTTTGAPAVVTLKAGAGEVAVFAYDLARSVVYTRQGNPSWSGMERDGIPPMRSDDLFYGAASYDQQPDWVNLKKVAIPQADEQQRLLANLILQMNPEKPLPRFWYFPRDVKAVVIMTGDDHGRGGTTGRFRIFDKESPKDCSIDAWSCVRATSNIFPGAATSRQAELLVGDGFEIGLHVYTGCRDWPREEFRGPNGQLYSRDSMQQANSLYTRQLAAFATDYPSVPPPSTSRTDCITWGDFDTQPQVELQHGIRLDTNYYYWPPKWVKNQPGMFTGSGMPMRFAKMDGSLIDVYQATTQMTDESGQTYPYTIDTLLDNAVGSAQYFGVFTANMHTDKEQSAGAEAILRSAQAHHVPIVSAVQMLRWLDGRNGSSFRQVEWKDRSLRFAISVAEGSDGIQALLPLASATGALAHITLNGAPVPFHPFSFAGQQYARFAAIPGHYEAQYAAAEAPLQQASR
jgi:hypothetical protein